MGNHGYTFLVSLFFMRFLVRKKMTIEKDEAMMLFVFS